VHDAAARTRADAGAHDDFCPLPPVTHQTPTNSTHAPEGFRRLHLARTLTKRPAHLPAAAVLAERERHVAHRLRQRLHPHGLVVCECVVLRTQCAVWKARAATMWSAAAREVTAAAGGRHGRPRVQQRCTGARVELQAIATTRCCSGAVVHGLMRHRQHATAATGHCGPVLRLLRGPLGSWRRR
jgi:hypothetical protein